MPIPIAGIAGIIGKASGLFKRDASGSSAFGRLFSRKKRQAYKKYKDAGAPSFFQQLTGTIFSIFQKD